MATPGLVLGPQDPDSSSDLTAKLGVHNKADKLLKRHAANWPLALTKALARPKDFERSETLDHDEVVSALEALRGRRAFFEDGDTFEDASVRGTSEKDRIVSVVFTKPSGRTAYGVIPYAGLSASERAYEAAKAKAENPGLAVAPAAAGDGGEAASAQVAALEQAAQEAEDARRAAEEQTTALEERLTALENPEPFPGYEGFEGGAQALSAHIKADGAAEYGRAGLERIRTYEEGRAQPRKTVLAAVEDALASIPAPTDE